jgi:hypothetical protein
MTNFHKPTVGGLAVAILIACMLAMTAPASAKSGGGSGKSGGGSSGSQKKPGHPRPPVFLDGSGAGRAVGSGCSISRKPVTNASGAVVSYRRVQVCNLD